MITLIFSTFLSLLLNQVSAKIEDSKVNFSDDFTVCDPNLCGTPPPLCGDGTPAPTPPKSCCPDVTQCQTLNCAAIGCLVELCPNGQIPPVPEGRCCPSGLLCPRDDCNLIPCSNTTCPDGSIPPTPAGKCCPDPDLCDRKKECAAIEKFCTLEYCANGDLAPVPDGGCCPSSTLCPMDECAGVSCHPKVCPLTRDLAPIPQNSCCPSIEECSNTNCSQVRCILERCTDGSIAPIPEGSCCPSQRMCDTTTTPRISPLWSDHYTLGLDCSKVTCLLARCPGTGMVAPVPWGNCCPNQSLCPTEYWPTPVGFIPHPLPRRHPQPGLKKSVEPF